jgi:serine-type D-Ala-D-Ala carboxypeptidase (penicillin-binding protein 5/6)
VVDLASGQVLYAKRPDQRRPIASLAKIMTALLVLRHASLNDVVTVTKWATRTDPINLGLKPGERITVRNLLYGLLLRSGNDTAVALAQHVSGTVPRFLALMDRTARSLDADDTLFASPNGLNDHGYSTAADMARIATAAMGIPTFRRIVSTRTYRVPGPKTQVHRLKNLNEMLFDYRGATGVKTGYTDAAGNCVVASARRAGVDLLAVVLHDDPRTVWRDAYRDATRLLNYGFRLERASAEAA